MRDSEEVHTRFEALIYMVRGQKVMLDVDLAVLYGVETRALIQAVKRNRARFPNDFCFPLSDQEFGDLRSQIVISNRGGRRTNPLVFTEQGVAMLSGVLNSTRAIKANVEIMRTFVRLRKLLVSNEGLATKLNQLERKYDGQFKLVFDAIRQIMSPSEPPSKRKLGFGRE